jgi:hypothetical protein
MGATNKSIAKTIGKNGVAGFFRAGQNCPRHLSIDWESYAITIEGTHFDEERFDRPEPEELKTIISTGKT